MFASVHAGNAVTCGLTTEGEVYCWGSKYDSVPELIPGDHTFTSITVGEAGNYHSFGHSHACGIDETGRAYCWGWNTWGQLGNGEDQWVLEDSWVTEPVTVLGDMRFRSLAAGADNTCGLTSDGSVYCWGRNGDGHLGTPPGESTDPILLPTDLKFEALTSGEWFKCGITTGQETYCWGDDYYGQLGDGSDSLHVNPIPSRVVGLPVLSSITSGWQHTCGLASVGAVLYCWGWNISRQLNDGTTEDRDSAVVSGLNMQSFVAVDAGSLGTCGLTAESRVFCWGQMDMGGGGPLEPRLITGIPKMSAISVGTFHACGLSTDRWIYCWGMGYYGQLGRPRDEDHWIGYPQEPASIAEPH